MGPAIQPEEKLDSEEVQNGFERGERLFKINFGEKNGKDTL